MKSDGIVKHAALAFVIALVVYVSFYAWDRNLRLRNGPWEVTFTAGDKGAPAIVINEPKLNISNLKIEFPGEPAAATNATVVFDTPAKTTPFGKLIFDDLMYQPGTVTLDLFGHEIELLPRTLIVNKKEIPWKSGMTLQMKPEEKLPPKVEKKP